MKTKMSNDLLNKNGLECFVAPQRMNRAVKNANRLYLFPTISDNSDNPDVISIRVDNAALEKLSAKCSKRELEMLKLLISGYNQTEIAEQLNISQSTVSRKVTKFKKILLTSK